MAKRNKKSRPPANAAKAKTKRGGGGGTTAPSKSKKTGGTMASMQGAMAAYKRLLADPCMGPMVSAPYAGTGSGYLVRTTDQISIIYAGASTSVDFALEFTPWNFPNSIVAAIGTAGDTGLTSVSASISNFVTNTLVVKTARPVACCLKWIPSGPYGNRAGVIGMAYAPSKTMTAGDDLTPTLLLSQCQRLAGNGSEHHEILWLPSFADERFSSSAEQNISGVGSLLVVGKSVDATSGATSSANGYIEVTTVWEWVPQHRDQSSRIPASIAAPPRFSVNDVLSSLGDIGHFVTQAARVGGSAYRYLTNGVNTNRSAPSGYIQM